MRIPSWGSPGELQGGQNGTPRKGGLPRPSPADPRPSGPKMGAWVEVQISVQTKVPPRHQGLHSGLGTWWAPRRDLADALRRSAPGWSPAYRRGPVGGRGRRPGQGKTPGLLPVRPGGTHGVSRRGFLGPRGRSFWSWCAILTGLGEETTADLLVLRAKACSAPGDRPRPGHANRFPWGTVT